jgi:hypothetical protein
MDREKLAPFSCIHSLYMASISGRGCFHCVDLRAPKRRQILSMSVTKSSRARRTGWRGCRSTVAPSR